MPSIIEILNTLSANRAIKQHIEQIESFYKKFKVNSLEDFLNEDENALNTNPILNELKKTLESNAITAQNPSKEELEVIQKELQKKKKDIGQLSFQGKDSILKSLNEIIEKIIGFTKQQQTAKSDEKRKESYLNAKDAIQKADIELLKIKIKKHKNIKDIAELYKLINPSIISLARAFSLKNEMVNNDVNHKENLTICLNSIREELKFSSDKAINLSNLEKISKWSTFKLSLNKKLEQKKRKENAPSSSMANPDTNQSTEVLNELRKENQELIKEVAELKGKITSLEAAARTSNVEEKKLIETSSSSKDQTDDRITDLNNHLQQLTELNILLTTEVGAFKKQKIEQELIFLNSNKDLEKLNAELKVKEEQITKNLEKLKQHEELLNLKETSLIESKQTLEASQKENEKLSQDSSSLSKNLNEKARELNTLQAEHSQIKLQIEELKDTLEQTNLSNLFNSGMLKQKEDEITKLQAALDQLRTELKSDNDNFSKSTAEDKIILSLETDINEKTTLLEKLENKLQAAKKESAQTKNEADNLKRQLEARSQELNHNASQLKILTGQFEILSTQKGELEKNYEAQLAKHENLKAQHESNIKGLEVELTDLHKKNELTCSENIELRKNIDSLENRLQGERIGLSLAEEEISKLKIELSKSQDKLTLTDRELNSQLNQTKDEKEYIRKKFESIIAEYNSFISQADKLLFNATTSDFGIPFSSMQPGHSHDEFKQILKKIEALKEQVAKNDKLEDEILELKLTNVTLDSENTKQLAEEIEDLKKQIQELLEKNDSLYEQNKNLIHDLRHGSISIEEDSEPEFDESGFPFDTVEADNNFDDEDEIKAYKSFPEVLEELAEVKNKLEQTQIELQQKIDELSQLHEQLESQEKLKKEIDELERSFQENAETISALKDEKEKLNQNLEEKQNALKVSENEIICLKNELAKLNEKELSNSGHISELESKLATLNTLKSQQQESIQKLTEKLGVFHNKVQDLEIAKNEFENQKSDLQAQISELTKKNTPSQQLLDQPSVNDGLIPELEDRLTAYENKLIAAKGEIQTLKEQLKIKQTNDSNLKDNYAKLDKELSEKKLELTIIQTALENTKKQLEETRVKNIIQGELVMPENEVDLISFEDSTDGNPSIQVHHKTNLTNKNSSSSGNSSRNSSNSSPASNPEEEYNFFDSFAQSRQSSADEAYSEGSSGSINDSEFQPQISETPSALRQAHSTSDLRSFNFGSSGTSRPLIKDEATLEPPIVPIINPINGGTRMPTQEQQDVQIDTLFSSDEFQKQLKAALASQFGHDYKQIVDNPANLLAVSLKNSLKNLDSEKSKRQTLADNNVNTLLTSDSTKAEIKAVLTELHTQADYADLSTPKKGEILLNKLLPDSNPFNTPIDKVCTNLLKTSLEKNIDNVNKLIQHAKGVIGTFKEDNHAEISQAFTKEFEQIATDAANALFNENIVVNSGLPTFKNELGEKAIEEVQSLISVLSNKNELLSGIVVGIHTDGLNSSTYLDEVKNSASFIFGTLSVNQKNYKNYIADVGRDLLTNLCIKNLQTEEKANLIKTAKGTLERKATRDNLEPTEHTESIKTAAIELVTKLLQKNNIKDLIDQISNSCIDDMNLLEASKQKLQEQLEQQISQSFHHYFPIVHLAPIFQKIKNGEILSEEEMQKLPLELQYADTLEEFTLGLSAKYPHLKILPLLSIEQFEKSRSLLRKEALEALNSTLNTDENIIALDAEKWLEKKLQLITEKSIDLKLDSKRHKELDNKFHKLFPLSPLEDMAITHKSVDELTEELKKLDKIKTEASAMLYKTFSEIETKLKEYPSLINEDGIFKANLNNSLPRTFPIKDENNRSNLNDVQIKTLLDKINHRLENDVSKWDLFNSNNIVKDIANDIIVNDTNQFGLQNKETIQILVTNAFKILYEFHDLKSTIEKRKKWQKEIQQLYALTEKLKPDNQFFDEIEKREYVFKNMQELKQNDSDETQTVAMPQGIYIPNKCRIISNFQSDPSDTYEYDIQAGSFYKQDALTIGQTVTFAQKLANEAICKWSVTRSNDKCLTYKTDKKFFRREKNYVQEISFAQMIHSVNSFKNARSCMLNFGNCSNDMKEKLYLFAHAYNELRRDNNGLIKGPRIICNIKNPPNMDKNRIVAVKEEIKAKLNLGADELSDISTKLKDDTIRHQIIRSRG